ncbi:MAG TPA: hypothetical protein VK212_10605 [Lentimicrobium sp.]|nr:hypothetical protein [Lentimicrobium sp.]
MKCISNLTLPKVLIALMLCTSGINQFAAAQNGDTLFLPFDFDQNGPVDKEEYRKLNERIKSSDEFYARLKKRADSGKLYKKIYPLLFRRPQSAEDFEISNLPANAQFRPYKGDIIRNIRIVKLKPFGTSIYDTTDSEETGIIKTLNNIHFQTITPVIARYLQFKEGDRLDPVKISDNERIIRNVPFFDDARFIVIPVNRNTVDVILVVKDIFPLGADLKFNSFNNFYIRLFNRNMFGLGHQFEQAFGYDKNQNYSFYFGDGSYTMRNIRHSLTDITAFWSDNPVNKRFGFDVSRPFITPEIKFAGGLNVTYTRGWLYNDTENDRYQYNNRIFDVWLGYSSITQRLKDISSRREQVAITGRFYQIDYYQTPSFMLLNAPPMINTTRVLMGFNILRSEYYRTNMLFGYGKTEDIAFGHHAEMIVGWEFNEFRHRLYNALKLDMMFPTHHAGLIGLYVGIGGYLDDGNFGDGVLSTSIKVISPLIKAGKGSIRNFGSISYLTGLDRSVGLISINDGNSGNLFNNYELLGYSRIRCRIESVVFTPYYLLGFRFAPFWFIEAAMISPEGKRFANQTLYPAVGVGLRLRNENLVFSTFQFSLTYHPIAPESIAPFGFEFSGLPVPGFNSYLINKPEMIEFK